MNRAKQSRELRNSIRHLCEMNDARVGFSHTERGHHRAIIFLKTYRRVVTFAASGDWRAFLNTMAQVRRTIREMEQENR